MTLARDHLLNRLRNAAYFGVRYPWVRRGSNVHVQWSTTMWSPHRHIVLGDDVGIGPYCTFQCDVEIGSQVLVAGHVAFVGSDDHVWDTVGQTMWASGRGDARKVVVEDDVWIGHGAILLSGAHVGRGSIVGAGALVVGRVEPYSILVAEKGRVLKRRFTDEQIRDHEARLAARGGAP